MQMLTAVYHAMYVSQAAMTDSFLLVSKQLLILDQFVLYQLLREICDK